ncbi:MAG TPA: DUF6268 family outer membrane beta-barrel protein [bacterium]|nr:DUF6268 family outer membrane beta-barrel protein [bacterium]
MRRAITTFLLAIIWTVWIGNNPAFAQESRKGMDIFSFRYIYSPPSQVESSDLPDDFQVETNEFKIIGSLPYFIKETKTLFLNGFSYSLLTVNTQTDAAINHKTYDFHTVQYRFNLVQMLPKDLNVTAMLMPAIASDFEGFSRGDVRANSGVLFGYRPVENLNIQFGVVYLSNFGEDMILPMFGLQYKTEHWRILANLPAIMEFWYVPLDFLELGINARLEGNQFHMHQDDMEVDYFRQSMFNLGPALRAYPFKGLFVQIWGGTTAYRRLETFKDDQRTFDLSPEPNWFVSAGLGYGL